MSRLWLSTLWIYALLHIATAAPRASEPTVLILGGGVTGVIAARTLHRLGINSFVIIEARDELGGRMQSHTLGTGGDAYIIEKGPNWIQGPGGATDRKKDNPIYELAEKHGIKSQINDFDGSLTTYDESGYIDYSDIVARATDSYEGLTDAGIKRFDQSLVDLNSRTGYSLLGAKPKNRYENVGEYFNFDFEFAQTPEATSWIAQSMNDNFTYSTGDLSLTDDGDLLAIDQRGFKTLIQDEAKDFLHPDQFRLNSRVTDIAYSNDGVEVKLVDGEILKAEYALCTFSLGVLQYGDVAFHPELPYYKNEAIQSLVMGTYTKIFFKFKKKFWFDTEMGIYADPERGRYPIWQSLDHPLFLPGSGIIFVTVTGAFSLRVEALPESQVKEEALSVLKHMFPSVDIPEPEDFYFPKWHTDPLFRGSYSNWPASFVPAHYLNLRANLGRLYFGGEATSLRYFGFLHGAYHEGHDIASIIAACINGTACKNLQRVAKLTESAGAHSFQDLFLQI